MVTADVRRDSREKNPPNIVTTKKSGERCEVIAIRMREDHEVNRAVEERKDASEMFEWREIGSAVDHDALPGRTHEQHALSLSHIENVEVQTTVG
jgi:hypothetical protein